MPSRRMRQISLSGVSSGPESEHDATAVEAKRSASVLFLIGLLCFSTMTKSSLDEFIGKSRIFQLVDPAGRERLARVAADVTFTSNQVIVNEGEAGDAFYAIVSG